jgi:hypothetical protein
MDEPVCKVAVVPFETFEMEGALTALQIVAPTNHGFQRAVFRLIVAVT